MSTFNVEIRLKKMSRSFKFQLLLFVEMKSSSLHVQARVSSLDKHSWEAETLATQEASGKVLNHLNCDDFEGPARTKSQRVSTLLLSKHFNYKAHEHLSHSLFLNGRHFKWRSTQK